MKNDICLVRPTLEHKEEALAYVRSIFGTGKRLFTGAGFLTRRRVTRSG